MIGSGAFNYINVLDKAADALTQRNRMITNNIANVDTPNYKRKDVKFEEFLTLELSGGDSLDQMIRDIELNTLDTVQYLDNSHLSYRMDGNNVDIDTEEAILAKTQLKYNAVIDSISQEFGRIKSVLVF